MTKNPSIQNPTLYLVCVCVLLLLCAGAIRMITSQPEYVYREMLRVQLVWAGPLQPLKPPFQPGAAALVELFFHFFGGELKALRVGHLQG